jgi:hypothetical protein
MKDINLYNNLENELVTAKSKNSIIQKVFENHTKSILGNKMTEFFDGGGGVNERKIYTPYEFLYELLPKVYGRNYIVSDVEGKKMQENIDSRQKLLNDREYEILIKADAQSIYSPSVSIDDRKEIEIERRKLQSDKIFVTESELQAYLYVNPQLNREDYTKNKEVNPDILVNIGTLVIGEFYRTDNGWNSNYVYIYDYISGDIPQKISALSQNRESLIADGLLTQEQFDFQNALLQKYRVKPIKITNNINDCLVITPYSKFAQRYALTSEDFIDGSWLTLNRTYSLSTCLAQFIEEEMDGVLLGDAPSRQSIITYYLYYETLTDDADDTETASYSDLREKTFRNGKKIMFTFLNLLTDEAKLRLELDWNGKYNFNTEAQYSKFPTACSLNSVFKNGSPFTPNETQVQSMQFLKTVGSGLLAYGVGVGKTASAIMNLSYLLGSNQVKRPLLIVPNAVYEKWKSDMFGGELITYEVIYIDNNFETSITFEDLKKAQKFSKDADGEIFEKRQIIDGHIPQWNKYVELGNLNPDACKRIKIYTDEEIIKMERADILESYIKQIPEDYDFIEGEIANQIIAGYYGWSLDTFNQDWDRFFQIELEKYAKKYGYRVYNLSEEQIQQVRNELKTTKKKFFAKDFRTYKRELPYRLGILKSFEDGTIFMATYEALAHLGLSQENDAEDLGRQGSAFGQIYTELSQDGNFRNANFNATSNFDAKFYQAIFGKDKDILSVKDFEFDCAIFDESHFIKNNYTEALGEYVTDRKRQRRYKIGQGKKPSTLAISGYFLSRYIGMQNNEKNVIHLTATPFTNSPNEIYGMLALTNYSFVKKYGFNNLTEFYDVFMDVSYDFVFTPSGVERKEQLVGFLNLPSLRNMIYSIMNYVSGDDANIKRPNKILLPSTPTDDRTILPETPQQDILFKQIKEYMRGNISFTELCEDAKEVVDIDEMTENELLAVIMEIGTEAQQENYGMMELPLEEETFFALKSAVEKLIKKTKVVDEETLSSNEKTGYRVMRGLNILKNVTLSPYLSICTKSEGIEPTAQQYIESSPKILYAISCIKSIHDYENERGLPNSGCVIYMNIGINVKKDDFSWKETGLEKIKKYFVNVLGYTDEKISIVSGKVKNADREKEKNKFLNGRSIVMIGSSAIATGVDLQNNASALFLCDFDWNPTTNEQVGGRIHRMGNNNANVRIAYPMIRNSFDPAVFQKLYEKTLRIKNLWDRNDTGSVLNIREFDLGELRKSILDEPEDLANFEIESQTRDLDSNINLRKNRINELQELKDYSSTLITNDVIVRGELQVIDAYNQFRKWKAQLERVDYEIAELRRKQENSRDEKEQAQIGKDIILALRKKATYESASKYEIKTYESFGEGIDFINNINKYILNGNSIYNSFDQRERDEIYRDWLRNNFPRFHDGYYNINIPQEDDDYNYIDYEVIERVYKFAVDYRDAFRKYNKTKDLLLILGIELTDIDVSVIELENQVQMFENQKNELSMSYDSLFEQFAVKKRERQVTQSTLDEKISQFAEMNPLLELKVSTFTEDEAKFVISPVQMLNITPNVVDAEIIEEEIIEEEIIPKETKSLKTKTPRIIAKLKNGLIIRFYKKDDEGIIENDLFYENGEFILYTLITDNAGNEIQNVEAVYSQDEAIEFYEIMKDYIVEEFYEQEAQEEEESEENTEVEQEIEEIKEEIKKDGEFDEYEFIKEQIAGFEIMLEIGQDEETTQFIQEQIDGMKTLLELKS